MKSTLNQPRTLGGSCHCFLLGLGFLFLSITSPVVASDAGGWEVDALRELTAKYLEAPVPNLDADTRTTLLDRLAREIGSRLASTGLSTVPTEDVALLSVLVARQSRMASTEVDATPSVAPPEPTRGLPGKPSSSPRPDTSSAEPEEPVGGEGYSDIRKGQEGFLQGVERLATMPVTERMTITGDITSGLQAATVSEAPTLTSTFGRARVNFVTRALESAPGSRFSDGYFFVQMVAGGGPFDTSPVGGPNSFSPLNDVATSRSMFNEGTSQGNLYLARAFYQQEMRLGNQDSISGRIGIIDLTDFFDTSDFANSETRQFLNSHFVNSGAYKGGVTAPGFMGEYRRRVQRDWLDGLVFRTGYAVSRTERAFTSPIWTAEVELQTAFRGYEGKYRFGGTLGNVADVGGVRGVHVSFDQWISRRMGVYGRYATSNSGPGSLALGPIGQSYSAGTQWRFVDQEDRVSAWGLGFSQAFGIETESPLASERALETYYRWQLTRNFALTPDFQLVFGSGGSQTQGTHAVGSLRMNFGF